jgi:ubiquinone/menaquinone biosynthesis C-methylase UbiE
MSEYTKKNVEHFDKTAALYDSSPLKVALAKKCADSIIHAPGVKWDPNSTILIDFACGTGSLF